MKTILREGEAPAEPEFATSLARQEPRPPDSNPVRWLFLTGSDWSCRGRAKSGQECTLHTTRSSASVFDRPLWIRIRLINRQGKNA